MQPTQSNMLLRTDIRHLAAHYNIRDGEAAAGTKHAKGFA